MSDLKDQQLAALSLLLQLGKRAREADSEAALGFVVVNETRQLLPFRQSAVWLQGKGVVTVSGLPNPEKNTPYGTWLDPLASWLQQQLQGQQSACWQLTAADVPAELAQDWQDWLPDHLIALALNGHTQSCQGLWLLARDEPWNALEQSLLQELASVYAHAWQAFLPRVSWQDKLRQLIATQQHKRRLAIAAAVLALFPVRLTVLAPAEVSAKDAFLVRAPLEGVVDRLHVKPNQQVAEHQPLFDLDTTGIRTRLDVARKSYEAAAEEYRQSAQQAVNDEEKSKVEMVQRKARMEEKAAELAYSQQLLERVLVKSPRAGVAIFADANDWIGKNVSTGERVMQIADPAKVEVSIRLPVADAIELPKQADVTLYLTTAPQYAYSAMLTYASYKPEATPDGTVAYRVKADFAADQSLPRLGLTGTAKLYGSWVPLSYYVLRRPLAAARQWIGW